MRIGQIVRHGATQSGGIAKDVQIATIFPRGGKNIRIAKKDFILQQHGTANSIKPQGLSIVSGISAKAAHIVVANHSQRSRSACSQDGAS